MTSIEGTGSIPSKELEHYRHVIRRVTGRVEANITAALHQASSELESRIQEARMPSYVRESEEGRGTYIENADGIEDSSDEEIDSGYLGVSLNDFSDRVDAHLARLSFSKNALAQAQFALQLRAQQEPMEDLAQKTADLDLEEQKYDTEMDPTASLIAPASHGEFAQSPLPTFG